MSRKAQKSGFMENFERFGHEPDKEDEGEEVKGFSVFFFGELKQGINFSRDILREGRVNIKRARTEKVMKTEDVVISPYCRKK